MTPSGGRRAAFLLLPLVLTAGLWAAPADTRLVEALARHDVKAALALLEPGAAVRARAADGASAIQWAAHWDDAEIVGLLLKAGADVNAADDHGVTALTLACENIGIRVAETLLKAGANPNIARTSGMTP